MINRRHACLCLTFASLLVLPAAPLVSAEESEGVRRAGWEESTQGRWNSLPERKAEAKGDVFRADVVLAPGTGVLWEKRVNRALRPEDRMTIEMLSTGVNLSSRDYRPYKARFPVRVTVVFGEESVNLPWRKRIGNFFRGIRHGFSPGGMRLTFAYGSVVPVGSMYRLGEAETVFVFGCEEDCGKRIRHVRDLKEDFRAAYGRDPRGSVSRILVSAERPSREEGPIHAEVEIKTELIR